MAFPSRQGSRSLRWHSSASLEVDGIPNDPSPRGLSEARVVGPSPATVTPLNPHHGDRLQSAPETTRESFSPHPAQHEDTPLHTWDSSHAFVGKRCDSHS